MGNITVQFPKMFHLEKLISATTKGKRSACTFAFFNNSLFSVSILSLFEIVVKVLNINFLVKRANDPEITAHNEVKEIKTIGFWLAIGKHLITK